MSGNGTISQSETRLDAMQIQSSSQGVTITVAYGLARVKPNLLWYGAFEAIPHVSTQEAGKGGSTTSETTTFTYRAAVILGLGEGEITDVPEAFRGKSRFVSGSQTALEQMGLSLATGAVGAPIWPFLQTYTPKDAAGNITGPVGSEALSYNAIARVYSEAYDLGNSANIENHGFVVRAKLAYSVSPTVPDADPADIIFDLLTSQRYGARLDPARLNVARWSTYCRAAGLLMSPAFSEQAPAVDVVKKMTELTNTAVVLSEGVLKFIPYGDADISGNGANFVANVTPVYDLGPDDFIDPVAPVRKRLKPPADLYNSIRLQYRNRANAYNLDVGGHSDTADIDVNGLRSPEPVQAEWICDAAVVNTVAQLMVQRSLYIPAEYEFTIGPRFDLLEPMDLVTLTDPEHELVQTPVRITKIAEAESGDLVVTAEDFPLGAANATLYPSEQGSGYAQNFNVAPGPCLAPVVFEAPGALTVNGLELCIAATGLGPNWGGCNVWVSLDGDNYRQVGSITGGSRYGTLSAAATASGALAVQLHKGQLLSGTADDVAARSTLCFVRTGSTEEFISYQDATLTGAQAYNLTGSARGLYGTTASAHSAGAKFVRVDNAIVKSGAIDLAYIGKTISIKLTSTNVYGGGEEGLADVTEYLYTITGSRVYGNAGAAALAGVDSAASDNVLTGGEKPPILLEHVRAVNEQAGITAQATSLGITTEKDAYTTAFTALTTYLATLTTPTMWSDVSGSTTIDGTTFRTKWAAMYTARQNLLNKMDAVASTRADWSAVGGRPSDDQIRNNLINLDFWRKGGSIAWGTNGESNALLTCSPVVGDPVNVLAAGPKGGPDVFWYCQESTGDGQNGGGWNNAPFAVPLDPTKAYRFVLPIRRIGGTGSSYWGVANVCDLNTTALNSNPYFASMGNIPTDRWYLFVGYVYPYGSTGNSHDSAGIWDCKTGLKVQGGYNFNHAPAGVASHRAYQYYASTGAEQMFGRPCVNVVDGTEPSLRDYFEPGAVLNDALVPSINAAASAAAAAASAASAAQATANAATTALTAISSDSVLSKGEKPQVVQDWLAVAAERGGILSQATAYGVTSEKDAYVTAHDALNVYLSGLSPAYNDTSSDTPISGASFRLYWVQLYDARQALLNKISAVAGTLAVWSSVSGAGKPQDNATVGAQLGSNLKDSSGVSLTDYQVLNNTDAIIRAPSAGYANFPTSAAGGAIKVKLPQSWTNTMLRFYVEVYEYATDASVTYEVGGYTYAGTPAWFNAYARAVGNPISVRPVYFGHDGATCCVWIGTGGGSWNYPVVRIKDFMAGYNNTARSTWETGWALSLDTGGALNVTATVTKPVPGGALSGLDQANTANLVPGAATGIQVAKVDSLAFAPGNFFSPSGPSLSFTVPGLAEVTFTCSIVLNATSVADSITCNFSYSGDGVANGDLNPKIQVPAGLGSGAKISFTHSLTITQNGSGPWSSTMAFTRSNLSNNYTITGSVLRITEIKR
jgi:hypothetical protein